MQIEALQSIILAVAQARSVETVLQMVVQGLNDQPQVALARIWLIAPGDICDSCRMRSECPDQARCLHLVASAGNPKDRQEDWSRLDGHFRRFPLNVRKIGRIGATGESVLLQQIERDSQWIARADWAQREGIQSFAGHPLIFRKELLARAIHERSMRRERPLIKVNCSAIPRELFESEFFGHVKGAFTGALKDRLGRFQMADGGTLFLDEIGEIPLALQSKLLRVLQEGQFERIGEDRTRQVDVRIIAATNRNLQQEIEAGRFRQDLYYRLSVFPITVPPLRESRRNHPRCPASFAKNVGKNKSARIFWRRSSKPVGKFPVRAAPRSFLGSNLPPWPIG